MKLTSPTAPLRGGGFTLIEILFATLAFSIVLAAINTVFYGSLRLRERADAKQKEYRPRFRALDFLKRDLRATFYSERFRADRFWSEPGQGLNIPADQIQFFTTTGITSEFAPWPDVQQVEYYLAPTIDPREDKNSLDLVRAVTRNFLVSTYQPPIEQRLVSGVSAFQLSFFDGEIWTQTWDSELQYPLIPKAVHIYLEFASTNQDNQVPPSMTQIVSILAEPRVAEEEAVGEEEAERETTPDNDTPNNTQPNQGNGQSQGGNAGGGQGGGRGQQ
ncbi:MAG: hypothetical protein M2R45_00035 [Verrucomicrobia subdivision 3 bacterium]|nr:hypothetical protein [Limisphaerales bacterium]MCS1412506.1 hypothetical protein [Limisphaerales bacterium]